MRLLIATLLVTVSSSAHCQFFNGNELFDLCKSAPQTLSGYVAGVADKSVGDIAFVEFWAEGGTRESLKKVVKPFCTAEAVTLGQMRDVVTFSRLPENSPELPAAHFNLRNIRQINPLSDSLHGRALAMLRSLSLDPADGQRSPRQQ